MDLADSRVSRSLGERASTPTRRTISVPILPEEFSLYHPKESQSLPHFH